jgi:hypothetical protein
MPDDHSPAMPQVTAVDEQFGTHTRTVQWMIRLMVEVNAG